MATASFKGVIEHLESFHGDTPMVMPLGIYLPQLNADDLFPRCAGADDYGVQAVVNLAQARIDELTEELAGVMERTLGGAARFFRGPDVDGRGPRPAYLASKILGPPPHIHEMNTRLNPNPSLMSWLVNCYAYAPNCND